MTCMAVVLLTCIGFVHWWPDAREAPVRLEDTGRREVVDITLVEQTVQRAREPIPPPPPVQAPPVERPDEVVLADEPLDLELPEEMSSVDRSSPPGRPGDNEEHVGPGGSADERPRPIRLVEPNYTPEARREGVRARIVVEVLVNEEGRVEDRRIIDRVIFDEAADSSRTVSHIGYGLEEAALSAAEKWRFRPVRRDGAAVPAYTRVTFSFGR